MRRSFEGRGLHHGLRRPLGWLALSLLALAVAAPAGAQSALRNGAFTEGTNDQVIGWRPAVWDGNAGSAFSWIHDGLGPPAVSVRNPNPNDARWEQEVSVRPDTWYRLSGLIRAIDVTGAGQGGTLAVMGEFQQTREVRGRDSSWQPVAMWFKTKPGQQRVTVACRLGGYGSIAAGEVQCADLALTAAAGPPPDADYVFGPLDESATPLLWPLAVVVAGVLGFLLAGRAAPTDAARADGEPSAHQDAGAGAPTPAGDRIALGAVFALCLGWAVYHAAIGFHFPVSDQHGFRQSQTAITIDALLRGGPLLRYETPVLGPPWSIPFEFPLYQWVVAAVGLLTGLPVVEAGRAVSEVCFGLALWVLSLVLGEVGVRPAHRLAFVALVLVSPLYAFWSRTVMIESTALLLCSAYLLAIARYARRPSVARGVAGAALGALAFLVKGTTVPGFALLGAAFLVRAAIAEWRHGGGIVPALRGLAIAGAAFFAIPFVAGGLWTGWADAVKAQNALGAYNTTNGKIAGPFIRGTLEQRFDRHSWEVLATRMLPDILGNAWVLAALVPLLLLSRRRVVAALLCAAAFVASFLLFTNLHLVHNYYQYANGALLLGAVGFTVVGLLECGGERRVIGLVGLVAALGVAMFGYRTGGYYESQSTRSMYFSIAGRDVAQLTAPDDVIVVMGCDWSSEIPFYAGRRALMVPYWTDAEVLEASIRALKGEHVGALVVCRYYDINPQFQRRLMDAFGLRKEPAVDQPCAVYVAPRAEAAPASPPQG